MNTRQCTACKIVKPLDEFYPSKTTAGGHRYECKMCCKTAANTMRQRALQQLLPALPVTKHCPRCHQTLLGSEFRSDPGRLSGVATYCRICERASALARLHKQPLSRPIPCEECLRLRHARAQTVDPRPAAERFWEKVDKSGGPEACWLWTGATQKGYGAFGINAEKVVRAHRFAWEQTHGPIPDGLNVLHHCDNPPCCNAEHPKHLFLGTFQDNTKDMYQKERHKNSSLHPADIRYIRQAKGVQSAIVLACRFAVDRSTIYNIWNDRTWTDVT